MGKDKIIYTPRLKAKTALKGVHLELAECMTSPASLRTSEKEARRWWHYPPPVATAMVSWLSKP